MKKKSLSNLSRSLHRDLGYFFLGITLVYSITGFILSVRGLGWFKKEYNFQTTIKKDIEIEEFRKILLIEAENGKLKKIYNSVTKQIINKRIKRLVFSEKKENIFYFQENSLKLQYNKKDGNLAVNYKSYPSYLQLFISSHLSNDKKIWFYLALAYSFALSFFAISAIFIVKGKYGFKKRGIYFSLLGIFTIIGFIYFSY